MYRDSTDPRHSRTFDGAVASGKPQHARGTSPFDSVSFSGCFGSTLVALR